MSSSEWREVVKLFDVLELQNGKKRPNSNGRFPVFGGNGVLCFCNRYNTDGENIIIGRVGAYCGNINLFRGKCWISDNAILCKVKKGFFSKFVYYALKNRKLNQQHIGSTQPLLTQGIINSIAIEYYDVNEQKAIAKILSALDEKIEINNKINKNLEEMAQAIFKRWFVDFEFPDEDGKPYKSSGGKMVQSELGSIPKGWEVKTLKDTLDFFIGGDWGNDTETDINSQKIYCIRGADFPFLNNGNRSDIPIRYVKSSSYKKRKLTNGDIVLRFQVEQKEGQQGDQFTLIQK